MIQWYENLAFVQDEERKSNGEALVGVIDLRDLFDATAGFLKDEIRDVIENQDGGKKIMALFKGLCKDRNKIVHSLNFEDADSGDVDTMHKILHKDDTEFITKDFILGFIDINKVLTDKLSFFKVYESMKVHIAN